MNVLDGLIALSVVSAAVGGWRLGLVARATSWAGLFIGFVISLRVLPYVIGDGRDPRAELVIAVAVLLAGAFLGQAAGMLAASRLSGVVAPGPFKHVDRAAGAAMGATVILVSVWLLLPSVAVVPGWAAKQARHSAIARTVDSLAPPPPDAVRSVRRLVGDEAFPAVFEALRPAPDPGPPPDKLTLPPEVQRRVAAATVRVEGIACRRVQQGSGFTAGPDTIVTNAHVVAGQDRTEIIRSDGRRLRARVVGFDPDRDLAVLRVERLGQEPLVVADGKVGTTGAVFGHPDGQTLLRAAPAAVRQRVEAVGRDLYDSHATRRQVYILASNLEQGDSGGALVDATGAVVGVAFAIAPDRPGTAYALTSAELRAVLKPGTAAVDTGPCIRSV